MNYEIVIIYDKPEISTDFKIIVYKEDFSGNKRSAIKRANQLQAEWGAEYYEIIPK